MTFVTVATQDELPDGERIVVEIGEHWIAVFNVNDRLYAIEDICTHDGGPLAEGELQGITIECPRHGATFSLETGKPTFPATQPIPRYPIRIEGNDVQVDVDNPLKYQG